MGLWLQMTELFKGAVNYFEGKSKSLGGGKGGKHAINIFSIKTHKATI